MLLRFALLLCYLLLIVGHKSKQRADCLASLRANIAFIVDASDKIDSFSFEFYVKDYLNDFVRKLPIGAENVLVSVLVYSNRMLLAINPEHVQTMEQLLPAIRKLPHLGGSGDSANLDGAIRGMLAAAFPARTSTLDQLTRMVVLISSGRLSNSSTTYRHRANASPVAIFQTRNVYSQSHVVSTPLQELGGSSPVDSRTEVKTSENDRLQELNRLLQERVDYVFSIGLKGASSHGVQLLANGNAQRTFLLDDVQSYAQLTIDAFDPTLSLCSDPVGRICDPPISMVSIESKNDPKPQVQETRTHASNGPTSYAQYPSQIVHVQRENSPNDAVHNAVELKHRIHNLLWLLKSQVPQSSPTGSENAAVGSGIVDSLISSKGVPSLNWSPPSALSLLSPIFSNAGQYVLRRIPLVRLNGIGNPSASHYWMIPSNSDPRTQYHQPSIMNNLPTEHDPNQGQSEGSVKLLYQLIGVDHNHGPTKLQAESKSDRVPVTKENNQHSPIAVSKDSVSNSSIHAGSQSTISDLVDNNPRVPGTLSKQNLDTAASAPIKNGFNESPNWQDSAMHGGAILMVALRAGSGIRYRDFYGEWTDSFIGQRFLHPKFRKWTAGMYERVILELRNQQQPVVSLTFNGHYTGNYGWFRKALLTDIYPWAKADIRDHAAFFSSRTEPFSVVYQSVLDRNISQSTRPLSFCSGISAYLLVIDEDSPLSVCHRIHFGNGTNRYPVILYQLPVNLWSTNRAAAPIGKPPAIFSSEGALTVRAADELRIYAVPYSLSVRQENHGKMFESYPLLFALDSKLGISVSHLWNEQVVSPPGYQPLSPDQHTTTTRPCQCWFRSRVLEHWVRPSNYMFHPGANRVLGGFEHMRMEFRNEHGKLLASLVFDTRGAQADRWFTPERLKESWPWSISQLRRYAFVQFGQQRYPSSWSVTTDTSWEHVDLWIGNATVSTGTYTYVSKCTSLLLVLNKSKGKRTDSHECWSNLDPGTGRINGEVFMGINEDSTSAVNMRTVREITIWFE